jgi:hypothetical protein
MRHLRLAVLAAATAVTLILARPALAGPAEDRSAILELMDRYGVVHDFGTPEEYAALFTDDAEISAGKGPPLVKGHAAVVAMAERDHQRFGKLTTTEGKTSSIMRHLITNRVIESLDDHQATGICYVTTIIKNGDQGPAILSVGRYQDTYRKVGGRWLIAHRTILMDMGNSALGKQLGF